MSNDINTSPPNFESNPDPYPLMSIYQDQPVPRSEISEKGQYTNVEERMSDYLNANYVEKIWDHKPEHTSPTEDYPLVQVTEEGEQALRETLDRDLEELVDQEL